MAMNGNCGIGHKKQPGLLGWGDVRHCGEFAANGDACTDCRSSYTLERIAPVLVPGVACGSRGSLTLWVPKGKANRIGMDSRDEDAVLMKIALLGKAV